MRILIPTDFSDNARKALDYALTLFGDASPDVTLLNTWQIPHTGVGMLVSIEDILRDESERTMAELVEELKGKSKNSFPIQGIVRAGALAEVIRGLLREQSYDYVVMGTLGADDVKKKLLGSNTANVVSSCPVPVLVVPVNVALSAPSKVAIATDFKGLKANQLAPLTALVNKFNASFLAIHVEKEAAVVGAEESAAWLAPFNGARPELVTIVSDDVAEGVDDYVNSNGIDLLAVIRHEYGFFEGLFHRSVSRKLSMYVDCPMLVMPD